MSEDRLLAALADVAVRLEVPATRDLSTAVVRELQRAEMPARTPRTRRRVLAGVIAAAVLVFALPGPRDALASWLGLETVRIVRVDTIPDDLGTTLHLGTEAPLDAVRSRAVPVLAPPRAGAPAHAYVDEPAAGSVTLVWGASEDLPAVGDTHVGLLLTEIPGSIDRAVIEKLLANDTNVETVHVGTAAAYWLSGRPHELLYVAPDGSIRPDTIRLAANTLLWSANGAVFRLESNLQMDEAIAFATSLAPLR